MRILVSFIISFFFLQNAGAAQGQTSLEWTSRELNMKAEDRQTIIDTTLTLNRLIGTVCPLCMPVTAPIGLGILAYEVTTEFQKINAIQANDRQRAVKCVDMQDKSSVCNDVLDLVCEEQCGLKDCRILKRPKRLELCKKICVTTKERQEKAKYCFKETNWDLLMKCGPINATSPTSPDCSKKKRGSYCSDVCTGIGISPTCGDEEIKSKCREYCEPNTIKTCLQTAQRPTWSMAVRCRENQEYWNSHTDYCKATLKWACKNKCTKHSCTNHFIKEECRFLCDLDIETTRNRTIIAKFLGRDQTNKTLKEYVQPCLNQPIC